MGLADVERAFCVLQYVNPEHLRNWLQRQGSDLQLCGESRWIGTLPLSSVSRIQRADFIAFICRSRAIAEARETCSSLHTSSHGPFLRVNFPLILSVRLWRQRRCCKSCVWPT